MEAGTHSIWISEQLQELGHEVIVANVRELRAISHSDRKSDQVDAEKLARYARLDPEILRPIAHRTVEQQEALTLIRARNLIVRLRTAAVNGVRGLTKSCGHRMPASTTGTFAKRSLAVMPPGLAQALRPVVEQIAELTLKIKQYDRQIQQLGQTHYPETQALLKVHGVGHLTALTFVLTLGSKERFKQSRDVGCCLGLRPRRSQSGDRDPQLGITKAGNTYLRSLLIECANHIMTARAGFFASTVGPAPRFPKRQAGQEQGSGRCGPGSWRFCCITSGPPKPPIYLFTNMLPERLSMFIRCDDTVFRRLRTRFGLEGRMRNGSIDSSLEPQPAPSELQNQLIRVRIETRWRATRGATKSRTTTKANPL
jgi:transposase